MGNHASISEFNRGSDSDLYCQRKPKAPRSSVVYATPAPTPAVKPAARGARLRRSSSVRRSSRQMKGRMNLRPRIRHYHHHHQDKKSARQIALERELEIAEEKKALFAAAERGDVETVETLLDGGMDVNTVDANQMTPLHHAAMHVRHKVIQTLVDRGAEVNASDMKGGFTALHWVVINADPISIEHVDASIVALSRGGCDVNAADFNLASPLHYAAQKDLRVCVDTLMRLGADPLQVDITGRNCIRVAKSEETRDLIHRLRRMKESVIYHVLEISPSPDTPPPTPPRRRKVPTKQ